MLITEKIVFIELQKTGSTHIKKLLKDILGGKNDGKHNVPTEELLASGRQFMGSIRDPWGWYLSLWSYGCQQQGELFQRLTNAKRWEKVLVKIDATRKARAEKGADAEKSKSILPEQLGAERAKGHWYADPANAEAFREWLRVVCALQTRRLVEAGFAQSPIGKIGGLMTFRYFNLFVRGADKIPPTISTQEGLRSFEAEHLVLSHIIRQDALSEDLVKALDRSGVSLTDEQRKKIYDAKPTNKSSRPHGFEHYYDAASVDLVARREKFIIDKFGYQRPKV
ncbi:MAG: hypothetical protein IV094_17445 [Vitreoscilla sp.]|nr:hypothetical protein [Vitreoscilla sp.]